MPARAVLSTIVLSIVCLFTTPSLSYAKGAAPICGFELTKKKTKAHRLPSQVLANADKVTKHQWTEVDGKIRAKLIEHFSKNLPDYIYEKKIGNPQIAFWEKLGVRFEPDLFVPELFEILDRLEIEILRNIESERIKYSQALWPRLTFPVRMFSRFRTIIVKPGEPFPEGDFAKIELENKGSFLRSDDYARLFQDRGFPLGASLKQVHVNDQESAAFEFVHDMGHAGGMIDHPSMMKAVAEIRTSDERKLFTISEILVTLKRSNSDKLIEVMGLAKLLRQNPYPSLRDLRKYLNDEGFTSSHEERVFAYINSSYHEHFNFLGGGLRDLFSYKVHGPADEVPLFRAANPSSAVSRHEQFLHLCYLITNMYGKSIRQYIDFILKSKEPEAYL